MDDLVRQALARWPDVPDCTGWLALDARGRWRIGEAKDGPRKPITHAAMIAYINMPYNPAPTPPKISSPVMMLNSGTMPPSGV